MTRFKKPIRQPWLSDFHCLTAPPQLSREEFVAKYLPQYLHEYIPRSGILTRNGGRPVNTGSGAGMVRTKRERRIDEAFTLYLSSYQDCLESNHWVTPEEAAKIMASFNKPA